ncbi:hypothetical protein HMPREF0063_10654 [Aeromicrobium marinum DSM 15272]|uniref:Uncharacterized protein n=1 Tax=Aeromicrobium marinum DSM 15272 TaxID=585531 RepID=E2S9L4_9ACTN|nr:hypothetical protein [Aeromicrobium marinum]EFQ83938.1 hypothetical protein HMPREF0063_10654 [Aeromicrobium marinum DSM 15272]
MNMGPMNTGPTDMGPMTDVGAEPEPDVSRPALPPTGHPEVDEALDGLRDLDTVEVTEHAARFDRVHGILRDILSTAGREDREP